MILANLGLQMFSAIFNMHIGYTEKWINYEGLIFLE